MTTYQNLIGLSWIGDLSLADADVLATHARRAKQALEFGCGGSTQILAQCCQDNVTSVETNPDWIQRTKHRLSKLKSQVPVKFVDYTCDFDQMFDLIFVDGVYNLRQEFALATWRNLRVGGVMIFHDTRRWWDIEYATEVVRKNFTQTSRMDINAAASNGVSSNMTVIYKKVDEPYENWNLMENKPAWAYGAEDIDPDHPLWEYHAGQ